MSGARVGRPPLNDGRKTTMIGVRMDPMYMLALRHLAKEKGEPLSHFAGKYLEAVADELMSQATTQRKND